MTATIRALIAKETDEARWPLYAGVLLMIVFPVLSTMLSPYQNSAQSVSSPPIAEFTLAFGAAYVAIVAITIASRDFRDGDRGAWRVLPIRPLLFTVTKFITGLVVSVGVIVLAQVVHMLLARAIFEGDGMHYGTNRLIEHQLTLHVFLLAALYAISFAIASASRHVLTSMFLSVIAGALLYFLPLLTPALQNVSFLSLLDQRSIQMTWFSYGQYRSWEENWMLQIPIIGSWLIGPRVAPVFVITMFALFIAAASASWMIVRFNLALTLNVWRISWLLILVLLGLFELAALQVGSNLEPVSVTALTTSNGTVVSGATLCGGRGVALTMNLKPNYVSDSVPLFIQSFDLSKSPPLEPARVTIQQEHYPYSGRTFGRIDWAWSPQHPNLAWVLVGPDVIFKRMHASDPMELLTVDLSADPEHRIVHREVITNRAGATLHLMHGDLYVNMQENSGEVSVRRYSLAEPRRPVKDRTWPVYCGDLGSFAMFNPILMRQTLNVPPMEGLTWEERFELRTSLPSANFAGIVTPEMAATYDMKGVLRTFEATSRSENSITYMLRGERQSTSLEQLMRYQAVDWLYADGFLYLATGHSGMVVFDVHNLARPRKVGHYMTPGEWVRTIVRLDDGRVAVFGRSMHVFDLRGR